MADTLKDKSIQLSHGGGGKEMNKLIRDLFFAEFDNPILRCEEDAAKLDLHGANAFTTDSFTVSPLFLPAAISANLLSQAQSTISL